MQTATNADEIYDRARLSLHPEATEDEVNREIARNAAQTMHGIQVGDWIKFKSPTAYASDRAIVRKVNGVIDGKPTVRAHGHPNFIVKHSEILAVEREPAAA